MWELRKWGWGPKLPFNSIQPKRKKDNLFILLTKRNMQKLTCYTRWPSQWQLSATCLPLLCSAYMSIGSASKFRLPDFTCCLTQTKIKNQPIGKHSQFDWTRSVQFNLTSRRSWNCSETVLEYIFGARQGWPELKRVCEWAPLPLRGNQSTKKNHTPSDFRPPTRDGGDCYENSPVGLFRLKLLILENILQLWRKRMCFDRKRILFVFDQLWCRENAVILLSLPAVNCLFQLPTVSSSSDERWWKCRSGRI